MFAADAFSLLRLGIALDKGSTAAASAGLGGAGMAAFGGHWLVALVSAAVGAAAAAGTKIYKVRKLAETREKWAMVLGQLDNESLGLFVGEVARRYPQVAGALHADVLGTLRTERVISAGRGGLVG